MKITLDVQDYNPLNGFQFKWESGFEIEVSKVDDSILIKANSAGLISLATNIISLASSEIPNDYHIHLDTFNCLEEGSIPIIIQKV